HAPVEIYVEKEPTGINGLTIKGISLAKYEYIGVIDVFADYSPHELEKIVREITKDSDVIAAFKKDTKYSRKKSYKQKEFTAITNHFLFQLRENPQAGALFFSKSVWETIDFAPTPESVFSVEFLIRAQEAGFALKKYLIYQKGESIPKNARSLIKKSLNAARFALSMKIKEIPPIYIPSRDENSMVNAGVRYKKQKYITHTTLSASQSAVNVLGLRQLIILGIFFEVLAIGFVLNPLLFVQSIIGFLSTIYLIDVMFNLYLVLKTVRKSSEITSTKEEIDGLTESKLPIYTILCPLYKEAHILPQFIAGIEKMEWPKDKLDVLLLLEEDDLDSIDTFEKMGLPSYIRIVVVPHSMPKTKPKACNYGLAFAKGQFTVIFDAEDIPDPLQLKKAYLGFRKSKRNVVCLQAKLSYYNINQNLLTRFFTAEYSLWFGMTLSGLQSLNTTIPLGGTSNHFRTADLKKLLAWDPFNVTEDADLGMRLFKLGYQTAMLDSVTLEEGNSNVRNWIRQRSRWIKGYMQTYLVHTRESMSFVRERGIHALLFHLIMGGKIAFIFINPLLWVVTISYFSMYAIVGPLIDTFYPQPVLYIAITSLIFGNYLYLFCHIMGCVKNEQWGLIKYIYLIPIYWVLISIAGALALHQLLFRPFYWEKTIHGLHLKLKDKSHDEPISPRLEQKLSAKHIFKSSL
ncbi:MAG TPA: glycosyltransferase family 2 protein, partial [Xanthomonadales bacterium]|nr:glycosyltransferase family 2 protein [Xanthomonadales bacterium]